MRVLLESEQDHGHLHSERYVSPSGDAGLKIKYKEANVANAVKDTASVQCPESAPLGFGFRHALLSSSSTWHVPQTILASCSSAAYSSLFRSDHARPADTRQRDPHARRCTR